MDVAIVYESMFGNTKAIAEAIGAGVRESEPRARVEVMAVSDATPDKIAAADLLVAGGPTHILRMSSEHTRQQGVEAGEKTAKSKGTEPHLEPGAQGPGIREWLESLPKCRPGSLAASFDTRLAYPLAGGAAKPIARQLRQRGYRIAGGATGFVVTGAEGPLREGEQERARVWGAALAAVLAGRSTV